MIVRRVLGLRVGFSSSDADMLAQLAALTAGLAEADADGEADAAPALVLALDRDGDGWQLSQDGAWPTAVAREQGFSVLMQWLLAAVLERTALTLVHAGVVTRDGRALVLPAMSGRGKSTTTAALVRAGFSLGSDELAALDGRGHVHAYPLPLRMREDALARLGELGPRLRPVGEPMWRKQAWTRLLLPDDVHRGGPVPVGLVAFLAGVSADDTPRSTPVSAGQAILRLLAERLGEQPARAGDVDACERVARHARCYDVSIAEPAATAEHLRALWEQP
jgi:hypothetical protein